MFKKSYLSILILCSITSATMPKDRTSGTKKALAWFVGAFSLSVSSEEISEANYPNAYRYFESLREKYPSALKGVEIKILLHEDCGPCCIGKTIYFPRDWVMDLECQSYKIELQTEFIILHEAGHARYNHCFVLGMMRILPIGQCKKLAFLYARWKAEPQADDFACQHCLNPEAIQATIELFESDDCVNDLEHPSIASRIAKFERAIQRLS